MDEIGLKPTLMPSENVSMIPPIGSGVNFNSINDKNQNENKFLGIKENSKSKQAGTFNTVYEGSHCEVEEGE